VNTISEKKLIETTEKLLKAGRNFESYNFLQDKAVGGRGSLKVQQLYGLSLARLGATLRAEACISALFEKGERDSETCGLLGRIYKDIWKKTDDSS
jgi:hypothetical protein